MAPCDAAGICVTRPSERALLNKVMGRYIADSRKRGASDVCGTGDEPPPADKKGKKAKNKGHKKLPDLN